MFIWNFPNVVNANTNNIFFRSCPEANCMRIAYHLIGVICCDRIIQTIGTLLNFMHERLFHSFAVLFSIRTHSFALEYVRLNCIDHWSDHGECDCTSEICVDVRKSSEILIRARSRSVCPIAALKIDCDCDHGALFFLSAAVAEYRSGVRAHMHERKLTRVCMLTRNCINTMYLVTDYWSVRDRFISGNFLKCNFNFIFLHFRFFLSGQSPHIFVDGAVECLSFAQREKKRDRAHCV